MRTLTRALIQQRMMCAGIILSTALFSPLPGPLFAQDFGFGGGEDPAVSGEDPGGWTGSGGAPSAAINGEISAVMIGYINDFSEGTNHVRLGDIFSGKLNLSASASFAEGVVKLRVNPSSRLPEAGPILFDEAYLRAYFGKFDIEAGLRKLTWGKADSFGPLDVINPLDTTAIYPEMADSSDLMDVKIPRPLIHASWRAGEFSKLEGVFVPTFQPHLIASSGRWAQAQAEMLSLASAPDTTTFQYAQAGLRFTTTLGASDLGVQYYYGRLPQPAVQISRFGANLLYNFYHQIGLDYAQVIAGFNIRAELAANLTKDWEGDDGSVYNPALAWSLGFDRDLFLGVNLNVQATETIRLMNDAVGSSDPMSGNFDIEAGKDSTATRIMAILSRKFLRDELELRAAVVWDVEEQDFAIMPAVVWTKDAVTVACSGGVFGGDKAGQLGQYHDNNFVKIGVT
ncbi:MAG: hypothetical protein LBH70_02595, partial [Spirochaetaceae bacterium]|nr:hypothetical protein [Spirochaetaceae bacterium]